MDISLSAILVFQFKAQQMFSLSSKGWGEFHNKFSLRKESRISPFVNTELSELFPCLCPTPPHQSWHTSPRQGCKPFSSLSLSKKGHHLWIIFSPNINPWANKEKWYFSISIIPVILSRSFNQSGFVFLFWPKEMQFRRSHISLTRSLLTGKKHGWWVEAVPWPPGAPSHPQGRRESQHQVRSPPLKVSAPCPLHPARSLKFHQHQDAWRAFLSFKGQTTSIYLFTSR